MLRTVTIQPTVESWREAARDLLAREVDPRQILWQEAGEEASLFVGEETAELASGSVQTAEAGGSVRSPQHVPRAFLDLVRAVAAHRDPRRWAILYGLLWRMTHGEKQVLGKATDPEVRLARSWEKTIHRDIHKMHAFVRFRLVGEVGGRECFVAWFEPEYRIVRLAAPFFERRFAGMNWSILTPMECAHWDGQTLQFSPGVSRSEAPEGDALEELWRSYYRSIFNPARVKVKAMQSEMPQKYWANLPEAADIPELLQGSGARVQQMLETPGRPASLPRRASTKRRAGQANRADPEEA